MSILIYRIIYRLIDTVIRALRFHQIWRTAMVVEMATWRLLRPRSSRPRYTGPRLAGPRFTGPRFTVRGGDHQ